ncbi:Ltp family lipoprotein [Amycolatopsis sp. NPDC059657]|uniref:Ltp family lipoprotein n=1 Tax=Amycolatopsis sp. NPDC059657 TaxID=3346899 RepID=UPI00366F2F32
MDTGPPTTNMPNVLPSKPKKRRRWSWVLGIVAALMLIIIVAAATSTPDKSATTAPPSQVATPTSQATAPTSQATAPTSQATAPPQSTPEAVAPATSEAPQFSPQVELARSSAESYLSISGFSRAGLIKQLSSQAGDGYPKDVATQAVDSLHIDWNAQAAKSAQSYLDIQPFSCSGLVNQLSSSAGDGYTKAQATYGAHQTAACK